MPFRIFHNGGVESAAKTAAKRHEMWARDQLAIIFWLDSISV